MNIKRTFSLLAVSMVISAGCAFADGNAFTPLNFDDTAYTVPNTTNSKNTVNAVNTTSVQKSQGMIDTSAVSPSQATGNTDLQTAISKVDTALDDIKADQTLCKAKYADVDNQYKFIKNERNNVKKQVRANERRIKDLTKAKEKLSKNLI